MRNSAIVLCLFWALISFVTPAFACGGYYPTSIEYAATSYAFVKAEVVAVDEIDINAILKVDRYLRGSGAEYIVIMRHPPALQHAAERRYDFGCLYSGRTPPYWQKGSHGYFPLSLNSDGTYRDHVNVATSAHYIPENGYVEFFSDNEDEYDGNAILPVEEFESLVLQLSGQGQSKAPRSNPYPLMRFLNITTELGERYRLNPDRSVTWLDAAKYPIAISNDGSHVLFRLDDGELGFQYLAQLKKPFSPWLNALGSAAPAGGLALSDGRYSSHGWLHPKPGLFGTFSPDSNFVAVQEESRLTIYLFYSVSIPDAAVGNGYRMAMKEITSYGVDWLNSDERAPMVWSADSSSIAFQDSKGIWLHDIYEQSEASLILANETDRTLLDISANGRYIRYGSHASWTLRDVKTGEIWKNTLISPDESRLVHIEVGEDSRRSGVVEQRKICGVPLLNCPLVVRSAEPVYIFWHEPGFVGLATSTYVESYPWNLSLENFCCCCDGRLRGSALPSISSFAFDHSYRQVAFSYANTRIGLSLSKYDDFDSIDLSEYLDSPIVNLEWGQPVFYARQ